jgi:hypothetical protein
MPEDQLTTPELLKTKRADLQARLFRRSIIVGLDGGIDHGAASTAL